VGCVEGECEEEEYENEVNNVSVGTVWSIGAVEVEKEIHNVERMEVDKKKGAKKKKIEVTLDSGAGVSCWPENLMKKIPMGPKVRGMRFRAANGTELKYYGTKKIRFHPSEGRRRGGEAMTEVCEMGFHVTDTTKPLAAAMAMTRMGNRVVLEEGEGKSYIENLKTGDRVMLRENNGTYVFDVDCMSEASTSTFSGRG
jgi:hypothetical protein